MAGWVPHILLAVVAAIWALPAEIAWAEEVPPAQIEDFDGLFGAVPPDPALAERLGRVTLKRAYLPAAVDLSPLMPPPVKQELGSCVAHSVGYALRGYYAAIEHSTKPGDPANTPSPAFLHSQIAGWIPDKPRDTSEQACRSSGSNGVLAMLYMVSSGSLTNKDVPIDRICQSDVVSMTVSKNEYSIKNGAIIYIRLDDPFTDRELDKIKQSIASGNPVAIGMDMYRYFADPEKQAAVLEALQPGEIYHGSLGPQHGKMDAGHELVIVGYDDGRQAFKIENSWGASWDEGGFGWIGYDAAKADINEALVMDTGVTPPRPDPVPPKHDQPSVAGAGDCAAVYQLGQSGTYDGFVESEAALADLRKRFGDAAVSHVAVRPWPVCEALLTLDQPLRVSSRPQVTMDSGSDVKFGDLMGFSVKAPDFPSFLYVVYLQADGTAVNLVPRRGPIRQQLAPGTVLKFGDGKEGRQKFRASAPAGTEAIIAIAARSPLQQLEALEGPGNGQFRMLAGERGEEGAGIQDRLYLSLLRTALNDNPDTKQASREVTADVADINVSAK